MFVNCSTSYTIVFYAFELARRALVLARRASFIVQGYYGQTALKSFAARVPPKLRLE